MIANAVCVKSLGVLKIIQQADTHVKRSFGLLIFISSLISCGDELRNRKLDLQAFYSAAQNGTFFLHSGFVLGR